MKSLLESQIQARGRLATSLSSKQSLLAGTNDWLWEGDIYFCGMTPRGNMIMVKFDEVY